MPLVFNPMHHTKTSKQWRFIVGLLAILIACTVSNTATADLNTGLMAHWSFDDCAANNGTVKDVSGKQNNGTISGNLSCVTGVNNTALQFDGKSYIRVPNAASLHPTTQLTVSFWIRVDGYPAHWSSIISKAGEPSLGLNREYTSWIRNDSIFMESSYEGQNQHYLLSKSVINTGKWLHYTAITDREKHVMSTYINGVLNVTQSDNFNSFNKANYDLLIGTSEEKWTWGDSYAPFKGALDDIRLYNRALTDTEIATLAGVVVQKPAIKLSATSLTFGSQSLNTASQPQKIAITSNGTGNLILDTPRLEGVAKDDYLITNNTCVSSLSPKATCTFDVAFKPKILNTRSAEITIINNVGITPARIGLSGVGVNRDILGGLIDLKTSSIDYKSLTANITFIKSLVDSSQYFNTIRIKIDGTEKDIAFIKTQLLKNEYTYQISLSNLKKHPNKLFQIQFGTLTLGATKKNDVFIPIATLEGIVDRVAISSAAIVASKNVSETKPNDTYICKSLDEYEKTLIESKCNNFFESSENASNYNGNKWAVFHDTISHRLVDFDKITNVPGINSPIIDEYWSKTVYGIKPKGDSGRIPLILIHGWQGDKAMRNPAKLGLWKNSELHYWQHFLDYYLASPALQEKYHIYLYHYPTYKHVTYNGLKLKELLKNVSDNQPKSDLAIGIKDKGVVILAHSMGGMVARSAIEEYKTFGVDASKLKRLITLDTPHHGSPAALTVTWNLRQELAQSYFKDAYTQGSADLQWDNFDDLYSESAVTKNINERHQLTGKHKQEINSKDFDTSFQEACDADLSCKGNFTSNPWLLWLNKNSSTKHKKLYSKKYILYAGWMLSVGGAITNPLSFRQADNVLQGAANIPSGGAEPVSSALWYTTAPQINGTPTAARPFILNKKIESTFFYQNCRKKPSFKPVDWFGGNNSVFNSFPICGNSILITKNTNHPIGFDYRVFWDYDHEFMLNGAYSGKIGVWDKYISKQATIKNDAEIKDTSKDSAFNLLKSADPIKSKLARDIYITIALAYLQKKELFVMNNNTPKIYNPLKLEPLFLVLQRDLDIPN